MPTPSSALRTLINLILDARASHGSIVGTDRESTDPSAYGSLIYDLVAAIPGAADLPGKVDELDGQTLGEATLPLVNRVGLDAERSKEVLSEVVELVQQVLGATVHGVGNVIKAIESTQAPAPAAADPEAKADEAKPEAPAAPAEAAPSGGEGEGQPAAAEPEAPAPEAEAEPATPAAEGTSEATPVPPSDPLQEVSATAEAPPEGDALTPPVEGEADSKGA